MKKPDVNNYTIDKVTKTWTYHGPIHSIKNSLEEFKSVRIKLTLSTILQVVIWGILLFINPITTIHMHFSLPFVLQIAPLSLMVINCAYMFIYQCDLTIRQYNKSYRQFVYSSKALFVIAIIASVGLLYLSFKGLPYVDILISIVCEILVLANSMFAKQQYKQIKFVQTEGILYGKL